MNWIKILIRGGLCLVLATTNLAQELPTVYEYFTEGGLNQGLVTSGSEFILNGKSLKIISGAIHYFRIHPSRWRDSLKKLRATGANTMETYVPWNLHEVQKNDFDFGQGGHEMSQFLDLVKFIEMAQQEDLLVLLRPGPYICSEWEFGGFPAWLLQDPNMKVRGAYGPFLERVEIYFNQWLPLLQPLQFINSGPIIGIQIENEYANFSPKSTAYLEFLVNLYRVSGFEKMLLYTSDNPPKSATGSLPDLLKTANFRDDPVTNLNKMLQFQPDKPLIVMEYWTGWFDAWLQSTHQTWDPQEFKNNLQVILGPQFNSSVNFYVFHGGTNFGFMAGSLDWTGVFEADVTSYDYDAPLSEAGDYTAKYPIIQELVAKYSNPKLKIPKAPPQMSKKAYGSFQPELYLSYNEILNQIPSTSKFQLEEVTSMEILGQNYGYIVHRFETSEAINGSIYKAGIVKDFGSVIVDGVVQPSSFSGIDNNRYWINSEREVVLNIETEGGHTIDLMVENMGRINAGSEATMKQFKGLPGGHISLNGIEVKGFEVISLEFTSSWVKNLTNWKPVNDLKSLKAPLMVQSSFEVSGEPLDTFLDLGSWHKGIVFINGFNLGRYFKAGPQKRLYVPSALLNTGINTVTIFEQLEVGNEIRFEAKPDLGKKLINKSQLNDIKYH